MAVVIEAVIKIGKRALKNRAMVALAAGTFVAIFFFDAPFPLLILAAALVLAVISFELLFRLKLGMLPTLAVSAGLGLLYQLVVQPREPQ